MAIPTVSWNESYPSGNENKSFGAERIREFKTQLREILNVDHCMALSGSGDNWGYHAKVTFYEQTADYTPSVNSGVLYAKEVSSQSELFWNSENTLLTPMQLTSGGDFVAGMKNEVRIYSGLVANIPAGWEICDGTGTKPNMNNKFLRGIHSVLSEPNVYSGGNDSVTLTAENMVSHTHTVSSHDSHLHSVLIALDSGLEQVSLAGKHTFSSPSMHFNQQSEIENTHTHTTESTGSGQAISNLPSYVTEIFIIKT